MMRFTHFGRMVDFPERAMQLFPSDNNIAEDPDFFFHPNKVLHFSNTTIKSSLTVNTTCSMMTWFRSLVSVMHVSSVSGRMLY
jgi:hypothetical protein